MLHALVMAGGSGTRFWPKSRRHKPKQFLKLFGDRTLIQTTLDRIAPMVPADRVLVLTGADQAATVRDQLPELPPGNIIGEPCPRDTAACVGLAASLLAHRDPEATMVVLSADHLIEPAEVFRQSVAAACEEVAADPTAFIVFGVRPTRPETGYGYIEVGGALGERNGIAVSRVARFEEKPPLPVAEQYLKDGNYLWNAGIFVWKARAILDALREFQPQIAEKLDLIAASFDTPAQADTLAHIFPEIKKLPIDKAVIENHGNVKVVGVNYQWSDVGDWRSLAELLPADAGGNASQGPVHLSDSYRTLVIADDGQPIVTLGLEDLVVVQSGGVTLVARKDRLDQLKDLVAKLPAAGLEDTI